MKHREKLLVAITSREQLERLASDLGLGLPAVRDAMPLFNPSVAQATGLQYPFNMESSWPLVRDMLREQEGAYAPPTEVLKWVRSHKVMHQLFPHISHEDAQMVAYTPDMEAGLRDKKVRVSMGRFLRKFFPLYTDDAIRNLESSHRAELDPTLEIVTGIEAVTNAYCNMAGDSGCMRYDMSHFGHQTYHPAAIYGSPGFGVAVHRDAKGTVKSRSVVWVNPDDPNDKRYVRIYGDAALMRKLERHGYKLKGLKGAKVQALQDAAWASSKDYVDRFVLPYIDPAGGIHYTGSKEVNFDARFVVRYDDDPDFLHLVTAEERNKLSSLGVTAVDSTSQSGSVTVPLSQRGEIMVTCAVTGKRFSRMEKSHLRWMNADGTLGWAIATVCALDTHTNRQLGTKAGMIRVYGEAATFAGKCLPGAYAQYVDNEFTMQHMHLARLDRAHYPADDAIYDANSCVQVGDGWIRREDAYRVQEKGEGDQYTTRHVHKDSLKLLRKMGYVSMQAVSGMKLLVHSSDPRVVETVGGRKALKGVHALGQLWDGRWDFTRNIERVYIGNFSISVRKDDLDNRFTTAVVPHEDIENLVFSASHDNATLNDARVRRQFMRAFGRFVHARDGAVVDASYSTSSVTVESILEAARLIGTMTPEQVRDVHYSNVTAAWARTVLRCEEMSHAKWAKACEMAEACAMEEEVFQSHEDFDSAQRSAEDDLLATLDAVLAPPLPTFMRSTATTATGIQLLSTAATATTNAIAGDLTRFINQI